jgi:hypothetical protein
MKYVYVVTTSRGATLHYSSQKAARSAACELAERDGWQLSELAPIMADGCMLDHRGVRTGTYVLPARVNGHDLSRFAWKRMEI